MSISFYRTYNITLRPYGQQLLKLLCSWDRNKACNTRRRRMLGSVNKQWAKLGRAGVSRLGDGNDVSNALRSSAKTANFETSGCKNERRFSDPPPRVDRAASSRAAPASFSRRGLIKTKLPGNVREVWFRNFHETSTCTTYLYHPPCLFSPWGPPRTLRGSFASTQAASWSASSGWPRGCPSRAAWRRRTAGRGGGGRHRTTRIIYIYIYIYTHVCMCIYI